MFSYIYMSDVALMCVSIQGSFDWKIGLFWLKYRVVLIEKHGKLWLKTRPFWQKKGLFLCIYTWGSRLSRPRHKIKFFFQIYSIKRALPSFKRALFEDSLERRQGLLINDNVFFVQSDQRFEAVETETRNKRLFQDRALLMEERALSMALSMKYSALLMECRALLGSGSSDGRKGSFDEI